MERAMHRRAAARVVDLPGAFAYLRPEIERAYVENGLWVSDPAGRDAEALTVEADRVMAGMRHRQVLAEGEAADELDAGFRSLGFTASCEQFMAHSGSPDGLDTGTASEVPMADLVGPWERYLLTDPETEYGRDDETRSHLLEHHLTYGERSGATERFFGVREGEEVVAWCRLWEHRGAAQVEDVVCLFERRGRGYGRAVVSAAILAALAASPELLFIVAAADGWPRDLYARLGFEPIGSTRLWIRD